MKTYSLTVSSPDGILLAEPVQKLVLRGAEGDLAVMAGHVPLITTVKPCESAVTLEDGEELVFHIEKGILSVYEQGKTTLIVEQTDLKKRKKRI
ncbi:MAG: hypothetical protein J5993_00970 [Clostridia bacterium]|nr:hypothetical protein [Clostridia bacterium]